MFDGVLNTPLVLAVKSTVMQADKAQINDRLLASKVS